MYNNLWYTICNIFCFGSLNIINNKTENVSESILNQEGKNINNNIDLNYQDTNENTNENTNEYINEYTNENTNEYLNENTNENTNEYLNENTNENTNVLNNSEIENSYKTDEIYAEVETDDLEQNNNENLNNNGDSIYNEENDILNIKNNKEEDAQNKAIGANEKENNGVNKTYINNDKADTGITELKQLELERKKDIEYIENYKGGELEPEWEWARNLSIVYTWVDGKDVEFSNIKSKYNGDTSNPRIQMISHKDIFPEHYRPTYDSNVIELFFDKIPGITEYILYFNDDIFLNNYVHPCFFFTSENHYPKAYRSYIVELTREKTDEVIKKNKVVQMFQASKYFTREALRKYFDPEFDYRYCLHTAYVIYRDMMEPFRKFFEEEIKLTVSDKFRSPYETHMLYMYQSYLYYGSQNEKFPERVGGTGTASTYIGSPLPKDPTRTVKKYSCEMVPPKTSVKYIRFGSITNKYDYNAEKLEEFRNDKNLRIYNLNDEYSNDDALYQFVEYMITRYPTATEFEKKEYVDLELKIQPLLMNIYEVSKNRTNTEFFDKKFDKDFIELKKYLRKYTNNIIKNYFKKKDDLAEPQKEVSKLEMKEIDFLLKYANRTREIEEEWQWVSDISIVYKLEKDNNDDGASNTFTKYKQLKYSLRSIEKYLPWFKGKIFIVTNESDEKISWINKKNKRITVIPQSQLIPKDKISNRSTVEMYLDKIPGLTEKFIYMKPNHFFIKYTHPHFFFSTDFYPKYYYYKPVANDKTKNLRKKNKSLFNTYKLIKSYFGNGYIKSYRFLFDAPNPLYRDLFEPVRELLGEDIKKTFNRRTFYLPIYLVTNYNIYGSSQPFYPDYVAGYGKVRNVTAPILNKDRTVDFYGFDIPSPYTIKKTILPNVQFTENTKTNRILTNRIQYSEELFFNLRIKNRSKLNPEIKDYIMELFDSLYNIKSRFEK
ncbi:hypothetical protein PIROE2DRAFT_69323 [Piromyces sp. E2]|nr:hypothetical protein PIROE2DRAFT_69323 [Piromyces sp. E2]|eukprot:OUM63912.1 hypothetical protein PIROE2DRAFT_69323 [Piromyces sp. E2]